MRKVLGEWIEQFTCPICGSVGAGSPLYQPLCHKCDFKVVMRPSNNGVILPNWQEVQRSNVEKVRAENAVFKVISGAQTGVDQAGLRAAKNRGYATGGTMPKGFLTLEGPRPDLAVEFGLIEHESCSYGPRTDKNVHDADATLRLAFKFDSPGEKCTKRAIKRWKKPSFDVNLKDPFEPRDVARWLGNHKVKVLNIAGNSEETAPGIGVIAERYLDEVFSNIW